MHPFYGALPVPYVPACGLHVEPWLHIFILMLRLATEPQSTAGLLYPSQCPCGAILLTSYSMLWGLLVSRAGPMIFYWLLYWPCRVSMQGQCFFIGLRCSIPTIVFYYFSFSLLSVYRLVMWGWGLRTDRVHLTLFRLGTADLFFMNNNNARTFEKSIVFSQTCFVTRISPKFCQMKLL